MKHLPAAFALAMSAAALKPHERAIVQDVMALTATLVNAAASRGERDTAQLATRVKAVILGRLSTT